LQVGEGPPFTDTQGLQRFLHPLLTRIRPLDLQHEVQVDPLLPGNPFQALVRVVDQGGNWQELVVSFHTHQRKVTINFKELHVINDSATGGGITAEFHIWVREGETTVSDCFFGDIDSFEINDRPDPGHGSEEHILLGQLAGGNPPRCAPVILGPKQITPTNHDVGILTRGLAFHSLSHNEPAANYSPARLFPDDPDPRGHTGGRKVPLSHGQQRARVGRAV
jgi:hypothetical protein